MSHAELMGASYLCRQKIGTPLNKKGPTLDGNIHKGENPYQISAYINPVEINTIRFRLIKM